MEPRNILIMGILTVLYLISDVVVRKPVYIIYLLNWPFTIRLLIFDLPLHFLSDAFEEFIQLIVGSCELDCRTFLLKSIQ